MGIPLVGKNKDKNMKDEKTTNTFACNYSNEVRVKKKKGGNYGLVN